MKYIVITEVDSVTKVPCTVAPQRNGPSFPEIKGLVLNWADKSTWPIKLTQDGTYLRAPRYYGTCDDDADLSVDGFLEELTEEAWMLQKHDEFYARKPFDSWVWDAETFTWSSPVAYPEGADPWEYRWDEQTTSWVKPNE